MKCSVGKANELSKTYENSFIPLQFKNPSNPEIHYKTTGQEIYKSTNKKVDIFVAGIGTGGTISDVVKYIKEMSKNIKVILELRPKILPSSQKEKLGLIKFRG